MRSNREVPEVQSGSMADIAFLLLIFFLVTTTMDTDTGIFRKLPPPPETDVEDKKEILERNMFEVKVNKSNRLLVNKKEILVEQLRARAKTFIANNGNDPKLPERVIEDHGPLKSFPVTKYHVISLQNDMGTSYGMYLTVQNELTAAYRELKDSLTGVYFRNKTWDELDERLPNEKAYKEAIDAVYMLKISEAEPKNIGGE